MPHPDFITTSDRLGFRLPDDSDFDELVKLDTDPEVRAQFPDGTLTPDQIRERIATNRTSFEANGYGDFVAIDLETGKLAGRAGFGSIDDGEIEVGYVFLREFWGRGLAQESLRALLAWADEALSVPRILAYAPVQHTASLNVMKKCGMRYLKNDVARGVECVFYEHPL